MRQAPPRWRVKASSDRVVFDSDAFTSCAWTWGFPMNRHFLRPRAFFASCALSLLAVASATQVHAAGGAFAVDDSEVGKPGECKVESWVAFADNKDFIGTTSPACV